MAQAIRQTTFVQSDGRVEIQNTKFPQGAKVEVIIILEEDTDAKSAEALAIDRLTKIDESSQLITVVESDQEIDENKLKQWVLTHEKKA